MFNWKKLNSKFLHDHTFFEKLSFCTIIILHEIDLVEAEVFLSLIVIVFLISVKPEVRPVPYNGIIITETGKSVTLECEVTRGFPTPEVSWHRRERKVKNTTDTI